MHVLISKHSKDSFIIHFSLLSLRVVLARSLQARIEKFLYKKVLDTFFARDRQKILELTSNYEKRSMKIKKMIEF